MIKSRKSINVCEVKTVNRENKAFDCKYYAGDMATIWNQRTTAFLDAVYRGGVGKNYIYTEISVT